MFCGTRWVENEKVASKVIDLWYNVVKICNHWEPLSKSKQPCSKSYLFNCTSMYKRSIDEIIQNSNGKNCCIICTAWIENGKFFVQNIFNKKRQSEGKVWRRFRCNNGDKWFTEETVTNESVESFRKDCSKKTQAAGKVPLRCAIVRNSPSISPLLIPTNPVRSKTDFKIFLERMVQINRIKTNVADKAQAELTKLHSSIVLQGLTRIKNVDKLNDRFDKFYIEDISLIGECCDDLCLGHGQAVIERGFRFINNYYNHSNINQLSL